MQDHLASMRASAMLGDINALPGAERQIAVTDRHLQGHAVEHGFDMGRHVIGPFNVVHPAGIGRRQAAERSDQIGAHVGVGVFLDDERSGAANKS